MDHVSTSPSSENIALEMGNGKTLCCCHALDMDDEIESLEHIEDAIKETKRIRGGSVHSSEHEERAWPAHPFFHWPLWYVPKIQEIGRASCRGTV